jgi:uncharacterized glyoxalase superfamily protein PhnB
MLSVFLSCDEPYLTAAAMTGEMCWTQEFASPADSDDKLVIVSLEGARMMLGTADEQWLPAASRDHRGAGVTLYLSLPRSADIRAIYERHRAGGAATTPLRPRQWGEVAFDAVIAGYRFLISQEPKH